MSLSEEPLYMSSIDYLYGKAGEYPILDLVAYMTASAHIAIQ